MVAFGLCGFAYGLLSFSNHYSEIYDCPVNVSATYDCHGYGLENEKGSGLINLTDQVYFYCNRWAVSEGGIDNPDGIVDIKKDWDSYGYPRQAYVTMKWHFYGLAPHPDPIVFGVSQDNILANRFYMDDGCKGNPVLINESGQLSKTDPWRYPGYGLGTDEGSRIYIQAQETSFDIYEEFSLSSRGNVGGNVYLYLSLDPADNAYYLILGTIGTTSLVVMIALAIAMLFSNKNKKDGLPFLWVALSMAFAFFTTDFISCLGPFFHITIARPFLEPLIFLGTILVFASLINLFFSRRKKMSKWQMGFFLSAIASSIVLFGCFYMTRLLYLAVIPLLLYSLYIIYLGILEGTGQNIVSSATILLVFLVYAFFMLFNSMSEANVLVYSIAGFPSGATVIMAIVSTYFYFAQTRELREGSLKAEEAENKYKEAKSQALIAAVSPHFLFNSLTLVESSYHSSTKEGDTAVNLLSKNLRASVDATNKPLIPLGEEMDHISDFVAFSNLRCGHAIEALFDLGYEDFMVPPLSLEVFAENSVRHGQLGDKEGGYIIVKTFKKDDKITIEISDNGCGREASSLTEEEQTDINNAKDRLKVSLEASVDIVSSVDKGTKVTIVFFLAKKAEAI